MIKNTPKSVLIGWTALAVSALTAYAISKNYTLNKLKDYTQNGSVTQSGIGSRNDRSEPDAYGKDGEPLRRSVNRRL